MKTNKKKRISPLRRIKNFLLRKTKPKRKRHLRRFSGKKHIVVVRNYQEFLLHKKDLEVFLIENQSNIWLSGVSFDTHDPIYQELYKLDEISTYYDGKIQFTVIQYKERRFHDWRLSIPRLKYSQFRDLMKETFRKIGKPALGPSPPWNIIESAA